MRRLEDWDGDDGEFSSSGVQEVEAVAAMQNLDDGSVSREDTLEAHLEEVHAKRAEREVLRVEAATRTAAVMDSGLRVNPMLQQLCRASGKRQAGATEAGLRAARGGEEDAGTSAAHARDGGGLSGVQAATRDADAVRPTRQQRRAAAAEEGCAFCNEPLTGRLHDHRGCVARLLGWGSDCSCGGRQAELHALCDLPSPAALTALLTEADVRGDGSCWNYTLLLWHGLAPHAVTAAQRPRRAWRAGECVSSETLRLSTRDRTADCALRRQMGKRIRETSWARDYAMVMERDERTMRPPTEAEVERLTRAIEYKVPWGCIPGTEQPVGFGKFGGNREFLVAADVLRLAVASMTREQRNEQSDRARISLLTPGSGGRELGGDSTETVDSAIRRCLQRGWELRFAVYHARHYHAMVPVSSVGKVLYRQAPGSVSHHWNDAKRAQLQGWLQAYDEGGGYTEATGAELGQDAMVEA